MKRESQISSMIISVFVILLAHPHHLYMIQCGSFAVTITSHKIGPKTCSWASAQADCPSWWCQDRRELAQFRTGHLFQYSWGRVAVSRLHMQALPQGWCWIGRPLLSHSLSEYRTDWTLMLFWQTRKKWKKTEEKRY